MLHLIWTMKVMIFKRLAIISDKVLGEESKTSYYLWEKAGFGVYEMWMHNLRKEGIYKHENTSN